MDGIPALSGPNLSLAQTTVATLAAALMIGIGFLARPGRDTMLWSAAFLVTMASTWGALLAYAFDSESLRRAAMGFGLGAVGFIWSGFRARRGAASRWWVGGGLSLVAAVALVAAGDSALYSLAFRVVYFAAGTLAALTIIAWYRSPERAHTILYPLMVVSALMVVTGVLNGVGGFFFPPTGGDDLSVIRLVNQLGLIIYLVCAGVSLVGVSTRSAQSGRSTETAGGAFVTTASDRLRRARAAGERSWWLLRFELDDIADLRDAGGNVALTEILARFETSIRRALPADADIGRCEDDAVVVLLSTARGGEGADPLRPRTHRTRGRRAARGEPVCQRGVGRRPRPGVRPRPSARCRGCGRGRGARRRGRPLGARGGVTLRRVR